MPQSLVFCENSNSLTLTEDPETCTKCGDHETCNHAIIKIDKVRTGKGKIPEDDHEGQPKRQRPRKPKIEDEDEQNGD